MPKYVTVVNGPVVAHVQGDGVEVYIGTNQVIVNGRQVYPRRPPSEEKQRLWNWLQRAERVIQELPMEDPRWVRLVFTVQDAWERYNEME